MSELQNIIKRDYSGTLYKYRGINKYTYDLLINKELYFSPPHKFNDPFDCQLPTNTTISLDDVLDKAELLGKSREQTKEYLLANNSEALNQFRKSEGTSKLISSEFKICCFSKNPKIIPQWAYYADSFKGIAIGFNPNLDVNLFSISNEVEYPIDNNFPELNSLVDPESIMKLLFLKSNHWKQEEEVRVIKKDNSKNNLFKFKPECLVEIVFGLRTTEKEIDTIKEITKGLQLTYKKIEKSKSKESLQLMVSLC